MAAAGSKTRPQDRGVQGRRGVSQLIDGLAPLPSTAPYVPSIDSLNEISYWLGTFRERLRMARNDERTLVLEMVQQLQARYQRRRAELS
jgi:hypothetical protein